MTDLLVPIGYRIPLAYNAKDIPPSLRGTVQAALPTRKHIEEFPQALGGRDVKPHHPIVLWGPDGTQIMIMGAGEASAAEIQDLAYEALEQAEEQCRKTGQSVNTDERRERDRLPRREDFDAMFRDALSRRIRQHQENPITDPPRIPLRGDI